jgi:DNA invertase Pin-like site-specific DNA recombinase
VLREASSGAKTDRRQLRRVLDQLAAVAEKEAGFRSLASAWTGTTPHGHKMLIVRGDLAEFERDLIRTPTSKGRECAKA